MSSDVPIHARRGPGRRIFTIRRLLIAFSLCLLLIPLLIDIAPEEIANWYEAAALVKISDKNWDGALTSINTTMEWQSEWRFEYLRRYRLRILILTQLRRFSEAVADCDEIVRRSEEGRGTLSPTEILQMVDKNEFVLFSEALNGRAYTRALGNVQLHEGLADIQKAIELILSPEYRQIFAGLREVRGNQVGARGPAISKNHLLSMYLDTRGYLYYLLGENERALDDLSKSLELAKRTTAHDIFMLRQHAARREIVLAQLQRSNHNLAVSYHHRGLVHQKLGQQDLAVDDLKKGQQLGYDPKSGIW